MRKTLGVVLTVLFLGSVQASGASADEFTSSIHRIDDATAARMTYSFRPGCPVPLSSLRLIKVSHRGFDGQVHEGELVVHRRYAFRMVRVFKRLFYLGFQIEKMRLVDEYQGDDDLSMEANNTSAFNCRQVEGRPGVWSQHAYGRAIDVNPIQNPYVGSDGHVSPASGVTDRSQASPGMIRAGDPVVRAFRRNGFRWGGYWRMSKDYQHFSVNGR